MFKIIIASHGNLANSMLETLQFFSPDIDGIYAVTLDEKGIDSFENKIDSLIKEIKTENVLIFTDLFYGTPFNIFAKKIGSFNGDKEIVAGVNFPALLESAMQRNQMTIAEILPLIKEANQATLLSEKLTDVINDDDE